MNILTIIGNELRQLLRNKAGLAILLIMPVAMIVLMGYAMKPFLNIEKSGIEKFPILYSNQDTGVLGMEFDQLLKGEGSRYFELIPPETGQIGEELLSRKINEAIILPENFTSDLTGGKDVHITQTSTGENPIQNSVVKAFLESFTGTVNSRLGIEKILWEDSIRDLDLNTLQADSTAKHGSSFTQLQEIDKPREEKLGSFQYFSVSMLVFFLLTSGMGLGAGIITERSDRIYSRIRSFPVTHSQYLLGKSSGIILTGILQAAAIIGFSSIAFQVDWGRNYLGLLAVVLLVMFISSAISVIASSVLDSSKTLTIVLTVVYWIMSFIGGAFVPMAAFRDIQGYTVNQWAFQALAAFMTGEGTGNVAGYLAALAGAALALWAAGIALYNRRAVYE